MDAMELLPIILYLLLIILVVVLIVLIVRLIKIVEKVDKVIDDVDMKVKKLNGFFEVADRTADLLNTVSDKAISFVVNGINWVFRRKKKGEDTNE